MNSTPQQAQVEAALNCIYQAFDDYNASFSDITRRARRRFVTGDRISMTQDIATRYALYDEAVYEAISRLEQILGDRLFRRPIWVQLKELYQDRTADLTDFKLYQTFFNTVSRRLFSTMGVDPAIEFTQTHGLSASSDQRQEIINHYRVDLNDQSSVAMLLDSLTSDWPFADPKAVLKLSEGLQSKFPLGGDACDLKILKEVFYRAGRAYHVGQLNSINGNLPIVLVFNANQEGVYLEAMLSTQRELSILFGFTFNYFMADLDEVEPVVSFLHELLPSKPYAELYTVLGRVKQGKTERYQAFFDHLSSSGAEPLVEAEGKKGMVMLVFNLPSYPLVFKLIRDRFAPSKKVTRSDVLERYHLVFRHDRIGRLIDAQEFRELKIPLSKVSKPLLDVLESECQKVIENTGTDLLIHHCYVERRVRPLDLYLREVDEVLAERAVLDYGQTIKDLAQSNIFAGDLLPKNFGVTGSGRVIFYDYDELRLMSECSFRHWPESTNDVMTLSDEPWFYVGEDDVFPEQFSLFMGLGPKRLALLKAHHPEIFSPDWWISTQSALTTGAAIDVPPFGTEAHL